MQDSAPAADVAAQLRGITRATHALQARLQPLLNPQTRGDVNDSDAGEAALYLACQATATFAALPGSIAVGVFSFFALSSLERAAGSSAAVTRITARRKPIAVVAGLMQYFLAIQEDSPLRQQCVLCTLASDSDLGHAAREAYRSVAGSDRLLAAAERVAASELGRAPTVRPPPQPEVQEERDGSGAGSRPVAVPRPNMATLRRRLTALAPFSPFWPPLVVQDDSSGRPGIALPQPAPAESDGGGAARGADLSYEGYRLQLERGSSAAGRDDDDNSFADSEDGSFNSTERRSTTEDRQYSPPSSARYEPELRQPSSSSSSSTAAASPPQGGQWEWDDPLAAAFPEDAGSGSGRGLGYSEEGAPRTDGKRAAKHAPEDGGGNLPSWEARRRRREELRSRTDAPHAPRRSSGGAEAPQRLQEGRWSSYEGSGDPAAEALTVEYDQDDASGGGGRREGRR